MIITAAVSLTLMESLIFLLVVFLFALAIFFFVKSRKFLKQTIKANKDLLPAFSQKKKIKEVTKIPFEREASYHRHKNYDPQPVPIKKSTASDDNIGNELKQTIAQQQKLLNTYLKKVEELENEGRDELKKENKELQKEINKLHSIIEHKELEMEELQEEVLSAKKMAARVEDVYREFDLLQEKMVSLEQQAGRTNALAIELEDARHSYEAVHNELLRKQEKLEEVVAENQRMRMQMDTLEDKLSEANLQRQQLHKKVQFLTDLNTDLQSISDTNKKLQTELRRIGELESMLNMMAEERDFLLRKKRQD
jgi:chromosome segregation ATPase